MPATTNAFFQCSPQVSPHHMEYPTSLPCITITNNKGRLSKEEIERMVNEAEKYMGKFLMFHLVII
jgi:hypothetical protein